MSVRPVPSMMLRATCSRFSDWPEYHCSPSLDTPASPFPAPRLPGHAPASPAPCQFRLLCFAFPVSPFPLHPSRFTLSASRCTFPASIRPIRNPGARARAPRPAGFEAMLFGTNWQAQAVAHGGISFYITKRNRSSSVYPVAPCCGPAHPGRCRSSGTPFRCASSHNG